MLAKEPADRFQTPAEVAEALAPLRHLVLVAAVATPVADSVDSHPHTEEPRSTSSECQAKIATVTPSPSVRPRPPLLPPRRSRRWLKWALLFLGLVWLFCIVILIISLVG